MVVATPRPEGLVRARGRVRFHTRAPALLGSLPIQESLGGKAIERRSERGGSTKRSGLRASTYGLRGTMTAHHGVCPTLTPRSSYLFAVRLASPAHSRWVPRA